MTKITHNTCPSAETILAVVEHSEIGRSDASSVFQHLLNCRECRAALAFVCTSVAFEQDRKRQQALWRQFLAKMTNGFMLRNNSSPDECVDAIAAESPAVLVLQSSVAYDDIHFWRATMTFPDVDQPEAPLEICVVGANGKPVSDGDFIIFGIEIPIKNGAGQLTRTQLAEFHHKGGSAFRWQDGCVTSGAPVLNT